MAEGVLFHIAAQILLKLSSPASRQLGTLCGLKDDISNLESNVLAIQALRLDADRESQTRSHSTKDWLEKLENVLYDADDVLDEFSSEALRREVMTGGENARQVRIFFSRSNQLAFNYRMAREVKSIRERLAAIAAENNNFHWNENFERTVHLDSSSQPSTTRHTHSYLSNKTDVIGRDYEMEQLKSFLLNKYGHSFIAIVGMGGIGKTTLAKFLYNDSEVSNCFELKMWVWVSDQFNEESIARKMIESATLNNPTVQGMDALQKELQKVIGGKKYLLVMDDIWSESEEERRKLESEEEWRKLKDLLMVGARGSKIIITKRDRNVAAAVERMTLVYPLTGLNEINSWWLFLKVAFKEGMELANPNLIPLGREIMMKCEGVPLVIQHIGRLLYYKTSEEEWILFNNNELSEVIQQNNNVTSKLELSYNHLHPRLKQCFVYSSLFPKGREIKVDELIKQWVAQGFIQSSNGSKSMEDIGKDYFNELCWRFFYKNWCHEYSFDGLVHMHDAMRALARKVVGKKLVCGNPYSDYEVSEQTRHISFDYKIKSWQDVLSKLRKAKGLRTFVLLNSIYKEEKNEVSKAVLDELFSSFPRLRVLGLDGSIIYTVPSSIKKLRHLRYLNLSQNDMEFLPNSIGELQNLQTLNLMFCFKLKELPGNIRNLVSLRHLDVHANVFTHMPEVMKKLTCLQTLEFFVFDCKRSNKLTKLNEINYIIETLRITGLEKLRSTPSEVGSVNLKEKEGLKHLTLEWTEGLDEYNGEEDKTVMEGLEPHSNVKNLIIKGYSGVGLSNWVSNPLLNLTNIVLQHCHRLQHLPSFNLFPSLQSLHLQDLRCLKFINKNEFPYSYSSTSSMFFPSLKNLSLQDMPNLEGWWELGESRVGESTENEWLPPTFTKLGYIHIQHCPKLTSIPTLRLHLTPLVFVTLHGVGTQMAASIVGLLTSFWKLTLREINDLKYLQDVFQRNQVSLDTSTSATTSHLHIHRLEILNCSNLMSLPEWIGLTTVVELIVMKCPKLKSLPEGTRQLKSLEELTIMGCPELEQRCKPGGEDWPKISHVPKIFYTPQSSSEPIWGKMKASIANICSFSFTPGI